jgi:hypothetical protein
MLDVLRTPDELERLPPIQPLEPDPLRPYQPECHPPAWE